jgi:hypothetical protein
MPSRNHRVRLCFLAALLLSVGGCGLSEYEKKMLDSQNRLERWEEEKRLLGDPIAMPTVADKEGTEFPIANVFLRLPKGLSTQPDKPRQKLLYPYNPAGNAGQVIRVEFAAAGEKADEQANFVRDVMRCFSASGGKTTNTQQRFSGDGREIPLVFDKIEFFDNQYDYLVYINTGSTKVAVVYVIAKDKKGAISKTLELSLKTFAADREATRQKDLFKRGSPLTMTGQMLGR